MNNGATARGQIKNSNVLTGSMQQFAATQVNIIDSIRITEERDPNRILAEWIANYPEIAVYSDLRASQAVRLLVNWSDRNGTVDLRQGDFFTFVVPDIFIYDYIDNVTDVPIRNGIGEIVATYSIYDNSNDMKEVKITFTDYVENHTNISGDFWMLLFVGSVASAEQKDLQFVINDALVGQGVVTVNPGAGFIPRNQKVGFSSPESVAGGYYIFEWLVYFNMGENVVNGFNTLEGFSFEDTIPADSPHIFLTDAIRQQAGLQPDEYVTRIGEYTGADSAPPSIRYQVFRNHYNSIDANTWYNFIEWHTLANGLTTAGINGNGGLNVSEMEVTDKLFSASLGTITRPTALRFYTIATVNLAESALGDSEVVGLFKNTFRGSYGEALNSSLTLYRFEAGGSAQGISGDYSFTFAKVNESGNALAGALFSLFTSDDFAAGADRFVFSGGDGTVTFNHLPTGTYYLLESAPPYGYFTNSTVYRAVLTSDGYEIYYGENFENRLSDVGNEVVNRSETVIQPAIVILAARKELTGSALEGGMFSFAVKDSAENTVATGTNNADGSIQFSSIELNQPGTYTFTAQEVIGTDSRIDYDGMIFNVSVTVTDDGSGNLTAEVSYPAGGIVWSNRFITTQVAVVLTGRKNLIGASLVSGMFSFVVKDNAENTVATGTNNADGSIRFSSIGFDMPGMYTFTVHEVRGSSGGIIYDGTIFTVTVTVTEDGGGNLTAEVSYPAGGMVWSNRYVTPPVKPCQFRRPCCRPCCNSCSKACCVQPFTPRPASAGPCHFNAGALMR